MALAMPYGTPTPAQQGSYQNPQQQAARSQLGEAYQTYLGRPMGDADWNSQTGNGQLYQQSNVNYALNNIQNSNEARAYKASQNQPQVAPQDQGGVTNDGGGNNQGGGPPAAPGVPPSYSGPNLQNLMNAAAQNASQRSSGFTAQQIRDFTGRELDIPEYMKTQFSQFSDPTNPQLQAGRNANLQHLLNNPESMSQLWQDQMFEQSKDSSNDWAKQLGLSNDQNLVSRGHTLGGGAQLGAQQDLQSNLLQKLLAGRRDVATQAATQNFADRLNVNNAAEQGLSGDVSRGSQIFQNILAGQGAQAGENQYAADYGFRGTTAKADNERQNYGSYLGGRELQGTENARQEQFAQSQFGLNEQAKQNAQQLALQQFLAGNNADLGWANYGLNADEQFLNYI